MLKQSTTLGRTTVTSHGYQIRISFIWDDGEYDIHAKIRRENDVNIAHDTIIKHQRVRQVPVYAGDPSLLDRLLGNAEQIGTTTNAETVMRDVLGEVTRRVAYIEEGRGATFDTNTFMTEIEQQVFPLSSWADFEDTSSLTHSDTQTMQQEEVE